jgi:hypothetical protein
LPFLAFFGSWQLAQLFSRIGAMSALKAASWSTAAKAEEAEEEGEEGEGTHGCVKVTPYKAEKLPAWGAKSRLFLRIATGPAGLLHAGRDVGFHPGSLQEGPWN